MSLGTYNNLLLLLSVFCFNGVVFTGKGKGVAGAGAEGSEVQARRLLHHKRSSSVLFNVKSFGAQANGQTDDSQVCSLSQLKIELKKL